MQLTGDVLALLQGDQLTNSGQFETGKSPVVSRAKLILQQSRNKRVVHVGCADHVELIAEKRAAGTYLHDQLIAASSEVIGVDTNARALAEMRQLGIGNLYEPADVPDDYVCDIVIAPDVIEHVADVGQFLLHLKSFQRPVLITTPNAFRLGNRTRLNSELVNSDHRYWFSPYTLARTIMDAGFQIENMWYTGAFARRRPVRSLVQRRFPLTRDGLAVLASPTS